MPDILPIPTKVENRKGKFVIYPTTKIVISTDCPRSVFTSAKMLQGEIEETLGFKISISKCSPQDEKAGCIYLKKKDIDEQAYELLIDESKIVLSAKNDPGFFYSIQSLRQLIRIQKRHLTSLFIEDKPYFEVRGFYHDVARGKVPTLKTLKYIAEMASFYKLNQLQLYVEHTFAFEGFSEVWSVTDPLTAEEILHLDEYCKQLHIELVPSLASFGHLYELLRSESFHHLSEFESDYDKEYSWKDRMQHHTLNVLNCESLQVLRKMFEQFIPLFTSNKFNICADETFDLGEGKTKEYAKKVGKGRLYTDFLLEVISLVKTQNKQVLFWGDIILKYPENIRYLPEDTICLNWDYSYNPIEENIKKIANSPIPQYVCPGVAGWKVLMNKIDHSYSNISKMITYGKKYGALGIVITDWGDYGHINLLANSMPGMIYNATMSWNPSVMDQKRFNHAISHIHFGDVKGEIVNILSDLSHQQVITIREIVHWFDEKDIEDIKHLDVEHILQKHNQIIHIQERILDLFGELPGRSNLDLQEFYISAKGIEHFNALCLVIKKYELQEQVSLIQGIDELAMNLEYWFSSYKEIWRMRNKESELYRIQSMVKKITKYLRKL